MEPKDEGECGPKKPPDITGIPNTLKKALDTKTSQHNTFKKICQLFQPNKDQSTATHQKYLRT